jgi:4-amino-4-deoxy-L-arabinose transferase-like glycosyltransferase
MLAAGFIPWALLLLISLFCLSYKRFPGIQTLWRNITQMEKTKLFSAIAIVVIFLFYSLPVSKRSVYLMPVYPFIAIFIAQYILYLVEYKAKIIRIFALFIGILACILGLIVLLTITINLINPANLISSIVNNSDWAVQFSAVWHLAHFSRLFSVFLFIILTYSIYVLFKSLHKKFYLKTLYAIFGVYLSSLLIVDGLFLPAYKDSISAQPIAKRLNEHYQITNDNLFVMNNLIESKNMYGLNFYFHNSFRNFEKESPVEGYFLTGNKSFETALRKYDTYYNFDFLEEFPNYSRDGERMIQIYFFKRKPPE